MKSNYRSVPTIGKRLIGHVFARFLLSVSLTLAFTLAHAQATQEQAPIEKVELFGIVTMLTLYAGFCIALFLYIWWKLKKAHAYQLIVVPPESGNELSTLPRPLEKLGVEDGHRY
jgi:hypothetical protein